MIDNAQLKHEGLLQGVSRFLQTGRPRMGLPWRGFLWMPP
jgi:hypothetical protein